MITNAVDWYFFFKVFNVVYKLGVTNERQVI